MSKLYLEHCKGRLKKHNIEQTYSRPTLLHLSQQITERPCVPFMMSYLLRVRLLHAHLYAI